MVKAVSSGATQFSRVYVFANTVDFCWPCGACRQFMSEFSPTMEIVAINASGETQTCTLDQLLPRSFGPATLKSTQ